MIKIEFSNTILKMNYINHFDRFPPAKKYFKNAGLTWKCSSKCLESKTRYVLGTFLNQKMNI